METLSGAWLTLVLLSTTCWRKMSSGIGQQSVRRVLQRSKRPWHQQRYLPTSTPMFHLVLHVHSAHAGVVRMKSLARRHVWWPQIDQDIEKCAKECQPCQENQRNPAKAPLHPWEMPQQPWKRLHLDFAGPFEGQVWLIIVNACSKWPEVIAMTSTTAERTINILRSLFSRYGIPDQIVTDNGPQFTAEEFNKFCLGTGITHTNCTIPPQY